MKLVHLSDLHIGKRVNDFSMLEDQEYILNEIIGIIDDEQPQAVIIAGDIYDKTVPPAEAVSLFDDFLCRISEKKIQTFVISGNHDSAERIAFGSRLMDGSGIHMSPVYDGNVRPYEMTDEHGKVMIYMLPFVKPAHVRRYFPDENTETYTDALKTAVSHMNVNPGERNILVTHQFVTGASRSDSEEISVGGTDNVDASVFDMFDYTALGHIHGPQKVGRDTLRYCGTPLKYSFSEINHKKSVTITELHEKGNVSVRTVGLTPLRDMREIKGTYDELTQKCRYENTATDDYLNVILTDEEYVPNALDRLRTIYPNIMKLSYSNTRSAAEADFSDTDCVEQKSPLDLIGDFYRSYNGRELSDEQVKFMTEIIEGTAEEEK